ncbi:hypothetical protein M8037_31975 [Sinorhizobium meliloti]|uniref:hypothetical protein n=1 Tax=Rhizobium meliloti TaxID=382 RepID=UPI002072AB3F|nr:hypothetical protein [Sinorhizobium meliloti]MCM5693280.1 hypothetical protein [Sinorhizobium meliloti]
MSEEIFMTSEFDFPEDRIDSFVDWFATRLAPDMLKSGFYTCGCYRAIEGKTTLIDVYQALTSDVFLSPERKAGKDRRDKHPYAEVLNSLCSNYATTVYGYIQLPGSFGDPLANIESDFVSFLRFDLSEHSQAAFVNWLKTDEMPRLRALGATSLRLVYRTKNQTSVTDRPRCVLFTEWDRRPPALEELTGALAKGLDQNANLSGFTGVRTYPWWSDKPEVA